MLKSIIFYVFVLAFFSPIQASMQYKDSPDDPFFLSRKFNSDEIVNYEEDLSATAAKKLQFMREKVEGYSLETDLIPQVVRLVAREALSASMKILDFAEKGDTVLYLGRSPSVLLAASEFMGPLLGKEEINHVQLNFSGTPNIPNRRRYKVNELHNVVTEERLIHFCKYLDAKGLNSLTTKDQLYIVDQVGRGGGMNAFLRILRYYYTSYNSLEDTPKVTLLLMNFDDKKMHLQKDCYLYNPKTNAFIFCTSKATEGAYRGLLVKAKALSMSEKLGGALDAMDDDLAQYYLFSGREYPAFCWTERYDNYRDSNPALAELFKEKLMEKFNSLVEE